MPITGNAGGGGGAAARVLPAPAGASFIYWDMRTTLAGTLAPGSAAGNFKNLGHGGALTLDRGSQNGDGSGIVTAGPSGCGVDFDGIGANNGNMATTLTNAPAGTDDVVMSVAFNLRPGWGTGSPILCTKSYPAVGAGWNAPFSAFGISLHSGPDGSVDWNVNVGGVNHGQQLGGRYAIAPDTDYWLDLRKRANGTADCFINGRPVLHLTPGLVTDFGTGEWMVGGNIHNTNDTINGAIHFVEVRNADLTDAQILARARAWLGWSA